MSTPLAWTANERGQRVGIVPFSSPSGAKNGLWPAVEGELRFRHFL